MPLKQVAIYHTTLEQFDYSLLDLLNKADQQKVKAFQSKKRQQTFVLGRALLTFALKELTNTNYYQLDYNASGKPFLASPNHLSFNISHSGNNIFLGMSETVIGIDCEQLKQRDFSAIVTSYPTLFYCLNDVNPIQAKPFYLAWTQHEAKVKLFGKSLFTTLQQEVVNKNYLFQNTIISIASLTKIEARFFTVKPKENKKVKLNSISKIEESRKRAV